mgnify:FL=1
MVRAKSTRPAPVKKKAVAKPVRRTTQRKAKKKPQREMPSWLRYVIAGIIAFLFLAAFFYFFIRPYSYRWKPCYGFKAYGVCMPSGFHVHGIDVSHYQGNIDWKMLTQTRQGKFPIHFVFMKASEGGDYGDKAFSSNFDSAKTHGFIRGAYHFTIRRQILSVRPIFLSIPSSWIQVIFLLCSILRRGERMRISSVVTLNCGLTK